MTNKKISLLIVLLILCSSGVSYSDSHNHYKEDENNLQHVLDGDDYRPTEVLHHTCGLGGTSCAECRYTVLIDSCGCAFKQYLCCCGNKTNSELIYCPTHYKN